MSRDAFECEPLDPIEVRGFDRPVEVFRVQRKAAGEFPQVALRER